MIMKIENLPYLVNRLRRIILETLKSKAVDEKATEHAAEGSF